tara:strand:+ start:74 stop:496 length:423 start_codon:yes stop_codon:yes gene_type:complete
MEKFLYFRVGTANTNEVDNDTGSNLYPVSNFLGACSGQSDANGAITDADTKVSIFLKPIMTTGQDEGGADDGDPDIIVLTCAQYGQKALIEKLLSKVNGGPHDDNFITLFDGNLDKPAIDVKSDVGATALSIVLQNVTED